MTATNDRRAAAARTHDAGPRVRGRARRRALRSICNAATVRSPRWPSTRPSLHSSRRARRSRRIRDLVGPRNGPTRTSLRRGVEAAVRAGFEAEAVVAAADSVAGVWGAVLDVAAERDAAVIVAGRRGISRVQSALMGSVSNGLVNHAPISVLVVPHAKA